MFQLLFDFVIQIHIPVITNRKNYYHHNLPDLDLEYVFLVTGRFALIPIHPWSLRPDFQIIS